jgi:hypothetical protein
VNPKFLPRHNLDLIKVSWSECQFIDMPTIYEFMTGNLPADHISDGWIFNWNVNKPKFYYRRIKMHTPNGASPFSGRVGHRDFTHEAIFTRDSLGQLLAACGFSRIECYEDQPVVHGMVSGLRWLLWRVLRGILRFYPAVETGNLARKEILSQNLFCVAVK